MVRVSVLVVTYDDIQHNSREWRLGAANRAVVQKIMRKIVSILWARRLSKCIDIRYLRFFPVAHTYST